MKNMLFDCKVRLLKANDAKLSKTVDNVAPINNILNSMIGSLRIYLNNVLINNSNDYYQYKSYIQTLFTFDNHQKESYLETAGW